MSVMGLSVGRQEWGAIDRSEIKDLRRRNRELAEEIVARAEHLRPVERELVRAVFRDGRSAKTLTHLVGGQPRAVRWRLHKIVLRVMSDEFLFVARHIESWCETRQRVARATILDGLTFRRASVELGLSIHVVRRHFQAVMVLFENADERAS